MQTNATVGIICRIDTLQGKPVVFYPDTMAGNQIQCWIDGANKTVPLSYYHETRPLSAADEEIMRIRFATATGNNDVKLRQRLPRVPRIAPNLLGGTSLGLIQGEGAPVTGRQSKKVVSLPTATPSPVPVGGVVPVPGAAQATPAQVLQAVQALKDEYNQRLDEIMSLLAPQQR